jgi:hypothetical protein
MTGKPASGFTDLIRMEMTGEIIARCSYLILLLEHTNTIKVNKSI